VPPYNINLVKPCPHCGRKRRLSPKTATVAVFGLACPHWQL